MPEEASDRQPAVLAGASSAQRELDDLQPQRRLGRLLSICFAFVAFDVGLFLLVLPWLDSWDFNHLQDFFPAIQDTWGDPYFRGALSGLGLMNLYLALHEFVRILRRA
jgi:hypothetical protein